MKILIALSFAFFLGLTGCASIAEKNAQNQNEVAVDAQPRLVERFTDQELVDILKEAGYMSVQTPRESRVYLRVDNNLYVI